MRGIRQHRIPAESEFRCGIFAIVLLASADVFSLAGGASLGHIALIVFLPYWLNAHLARRTEVFEGRLQYACAIIFWCVGLLTVMALLSTSYSEAPLRVGRVVMAMVAAYSIYLFVVGTLTARRARIVLWVLLTAFALVSLISIVDLFLPLTVGFVLEGSDRARGTFKNPNQFGIVISTIVPVGAALVVTQRKLYKLVAALMVVLLFAGLTVSGSKTNLLITSASLAFFALAYAATSPAVRNRKFAVALTILVTMVGFAAASVALQLLNPRAFVLLAEFFSEGFENRTVASRLEIWGISYEIFADRPFLGEGAGSSVVERQFGKEIAESHSHNSLIDYARTLGAPGLILLATIHVVVIWISVDTIIRTISAKEDQARLLLGSGLAIGSINYLVANQMSDSFGPSTVPFFWLVVFIHFFVRATSIGEPVTRHHFNPPKNFPSSLLKSELA